MSGELREGRLGRRQQLLRARKITNIGVDLACEDRIPGLPVHLRTLDLGVPVRALDQADHQPVTAAPREIDQVVDHERAALLVALDDEADAVPAGQSRVDDQRLQQIQRDIQPIAFFRVDADTDVVLPRQPQQALQPGQKFPHDPITLGADAARMQGGQLHGNAGSGMDAAPAAGSADGVDRRLVGAMIPQRIGRGHGGLAEHIVGERVPARLALDAVPQRFLDRFADDELLAQEPHREVDANPNDRLAALADQPGEGGAEALFAGRRDELAGNQQAPGGRIDEQGGAVADVRLPVASADLVADEPVGGLDVGNAQQGFGQAHQRDPLLAGERELPHQRIDAAGPRSPRAHPSHQPPRRVLNRRDHVRRHLRLRQQAPHGRLLVLAMGGGDPGPQFRLRTSREVEPHATRSRAVFALTALHGTSSGCSCVPDVLEHPPRWSGFSQVDAGAGRLHSMDVFTRNHDRCLQNS